MRSIISPLESLTRKSKKILRNTKTFVATTIASTILSTSCTTYVPGTNIGIPDLLGFDCVNGSPYEDDLDCDFISDTDDNCPFIYNPAQRDLNEDGIGNKCEEFFESDPPTFSPPPNPGLSPPDIPDLPPQITINSECADLLCPPGQVPVNYECQTNQPNLIYPEDSSAIKDIVMISTNFVDSCRDLNYVYVQDRNYHEIGSFTTYNNEYSFLTNYLVCVWRGRIIETRSYLVDSFLLNTNGCPFTETFNSPGSFINLNGEYVSLCQEINRHVESGDEIIADIYIGLGGCPDNTYTLTSSEDTLEGCLVHCVKNTIVP